MIFENLFDVIIFIFSLLLHLLSLLIGLLLSYWLIEGIWRMVDSLSLSPVACMTFIVIAGTLPVLYKVVNQQVEHSGSLASRRHRRIGMAGVLQNYTEFQIRNFAYIFVLLLWASVAKTSITALIISGIVIFAGLWLVTRGERRQW